MNTYYQISQLIEIQAEFFYGSDFTTIESLEESEYFRGGLEILSDFIAPGSKGWLTLPLQRICIASSKHERGTVERLIEELMLEVGRHCPNLDNFSMVFDLSTAHAPSSDPDFGDMRYESHDYGWVVWFTDSDDSVPKWMKPIVNLARANGCALIMFDADAARFEGLKTYEW